MYIKKSLKEVIYSKGLEEEYKLVIQEFKNLKSKENYEYVPIDYFFIQKSLNKEKVYTLFKILLEFDVIDCVEFIECDECGTENIYIDNSINLCSRCKESIYSDYIIENYKLLLEDIKL